MRRNNALKELSWLTLKRILNAGTNENDGPGRVTVLENPVNRFFRHAGKSGRPTKLQAFFSRQKVRRRTFSQRFLPGFPRIDRLLIPLFVSGLAAGDGPTKACSKKASVYCWAVNDEISRPPA